MSRFLQDAAEILDAAESAIAAGQTPSEYTILLGTQGGIRMIANSDWSLGSLKREHGAQTAYRVSTASGRLTVDGNNESRACHLEAVGAASTARFLLNAAPAWQSFAG